MLSWQTKAETEWRHSAQTQGRQFQKEVTAKVTFVLPAITPSNLICHNNQFPTVRVLSQTANPFSKALGTVTFGISQFLEPFFLTQAGFMRQDCPFQYQVNHIADLT